MLITKIHKIISRIKHFKTIVEYSAKNKFLTNVLISKEKKNGYTDKKGKQSQRLNKLSHNTYRMYKY
jgi:hypothetical protein